MNIFRVTGPEFAPYGTILSGYDLAPLLTVMESIPLPEKGTDYRASFDLLEACPVFAELQDRAYGGLPIQLGLCWGHNSKLNCLEYHRNAEILIGSQDFILLLAKREEIICGKLDTAKVKAFYAPAGTVILLSSDTLHYTPCHASAASGFRVAVILPKGTNEAIPQIRIVNDEDRLLTARNKWLLAHEDSEEGRSGAYLGLIGMNINLST